MNERLHAQPYDGSGYDEQLIDHRRIDDLGRIAIPKAIRQAIGITEGDTLSIHRIGEDVVMRKVKIIEGESGK